MKKWGEERGGALVACMSEKMWHGEVRWLLAVWHFLCCWGLGDGRGGGSWRRGQAAGSGWRDGIITAS